MTKGDIRIGNFVFASIVIVVYFFVGCTPAVKIPGTYSGNNSYLTIILDNDSTFSFRYKFEFSREYAEGRWKLLGKSRVVINSNIQNRSLSIKGYDKYNSSLTDGKYLAIDTGIPEDERKFYGCSIFVNDAFLVKKRCDSVSVLKIPDSTMSISVQINADERIPNRFLDSLQTDKYILGSKKSNEVRLEVAYIDSLFNYRVFNNVSIRITRKGLYLPSPYEQEIRFLQRQ